MSDGSAEYPIPPDLRDAFNKAVAEVIKRSAERLTRAIEEAGTYAGSE